MNSKLTLTIVACIGLIFSLAFFIAPEFVTLQQFPDAEGKGLKDLVTLRYALASLIACIIVITFQVRNIDGIKQQRSLMLGYAIGFGIVCVTTLILHLNNMISAIPPIIGTGIVVILSLYSFFNLKEKKPKKKKFE